jgi:hypothetical protein
MVHNVLLVAIILAFCIFLHYTVQHARTALEQLCPYGVHRG